MTKVKKKIETIKKTSTRTNWEALKAELKKNDSFKSSHDEGPSSSVHLNKKNEAKRIKPFKGFTNSTHKSKKLNVTSKDIWFDDVDVGDIVDAEDDLNEKKSPSNKLVKTNAFAGLTKVIAMDCEMVGVGEGGRESVLARVSLVNQFGKCIYDKFVKAREEVTDYRTFVSGVRPSDLTNAEDFQIVQKEVAVILQGRILVGHALWNDMKVLFLDHPKKCIRDTAKYKPFKTMTAGRSPSLRLLSSKILGVPIQRGEHSSVQDAQAAMRLYTMHKREWETEKSKVKLSKKAKKKRNANTALGLAKTA
ncbi:RNA exonuclease 4-like [Clavelina lepadiformis]|uniref:RNA exonuclease 4-like n=1 Tax=Clavelina lepadiformis TaxID=159417 RepID=UPI004041F8B1